MRTIIKLSFIFLVCTFWSCDSFLVEQPYSFASGATLFDNSSNAELAITGVYDILNAGNVQGTGNYPLWGKGMHYITNLGCDELIGNLNYISDPQHKVMANYSYNSESQFLSHAWFALYAGIDRANNVIKYVPSISDMDENRRVEMLAEAKYLRGFYYTYLTWIFGGIPIPTEPNSDIHAPREPLSKVYAQIISDLTFASQKLNRRNTTEGRVNRYTAKTLLAKVYLYLASCKENQVGKDLDNQLNSFDFVDQADSYKQCLTLCDTIYNQSGYILYPNYNYLFIADTKVMKSELLKESMMVVNTGVGGTNEYLLFAYLSGPQGSVVTTGGNYGWLRPLGELADKYDLTNDDRGFQNISGPANSAKSQTIKGVKYFTTNAVDANGANFCLTKFRQSDPATRLALGVPTWASTLGFPLLRFADVVLMYAEAEYKVNNDEAKARNLLKEIRLRAALNDESKTTTLTNTYFKTNFMDELSDERSRELCAEGWRRFDLIRWGKLNSVVANLKISNDRNITPNYYYWNTLYADVVKSNFSSYKIWFPIPKRELETNPNLTQNSKY